MKRVLLLVFQLGCAGLGANDDLDAVPLATLARGTNADAGKPLAVEVGAGATAFEPLAPNAPVDLVSGPQGGQHIWTSVRVGDVNLERAVVILSARFERTGDLAGPSTSLGVIFHANGSAREASGLQNLIANPSVARGQVVLLRVELLTEDGRVGADTRAVVPR